MYVLFSIQEKALKKNCNIQNCLSRSLIGQLDEIAPFVLNEMVVSMSYL
jgi:hypothetical protein